MSDLPSQDLADLFGREVASLLEELARRAIEPDPLAVAEHLRARLPDALARAAAQLFALRTRARAKLGANVVPFMTRKGLEQASAPAVAAHRARTLAATAAGARVLDATCGIGCDALALARAGLATVAGDRDAWLARMTLENARAAQLALGVVVADAERPAVRADVVVLDPDRRADGARTLDPARWSPTLAAALATARSRAGALLKLPPAFALERHVARAELERALLRWVGLDGELCELTLVLGCAAGDRAGVREAVRLTSAGEVHLLDDGGRAEEREVEPLADERAAGIAWLCEPDPSAIAAGLVPQLCRAHDLAPVAPRIGYLGGAARPSSPFLRAWPVLASSTADARRVRALLELHDVGPLTVKKRGHPDDAATLARRFAGRGTRHGLLAVARMARGHRVWLLGEPEG